MVTHYLFRLCALDTDVPLGPDATMDAFLQAMDGHFLAGGELVGEYVGRVILQRRLRFAVIEEPRSGRWPANHVQWRGVHKIRAG